MADNPMKNVYLEKVVINIGVGLNENMVDNAKAAFTFIPNIPILGSYFTPEK